MTQYSVERVAYHRLTSPQPVQRWINFSYLAIAVGIGYFLAARLSLSLLTEPDGVAVFWPAAGLSAGALISLGSRALLPVAAGTIAATVVANLLGDRNIWSSIVFALCNAGEAVLIATIIEKYFGSSFSLEKPRNIVGLLAATIVGTAVSGIGGTLGFDLFHNTLSSSLTIWWHWVASDALGVITVTPVFIGLASAVRHPPLRREVAEGFLALLILSSVSGLLVLLPRELWMAVVPTALLFPLLLWIAARCTPLFAAVAAFIIALTVVWTTTFGIGILGDPILPIAQRVLCAQAGILTASLCALVLAALFAEGKAHEAMLMHSNMALERERDSKLMNVQTATASMAHELKQPLAAILLNGEAAQQSLSHAHPDLAEVRSALMSIVDDSVRAHETLESIRSLFRRDDTQHEPIDLNEIALRALRIVREQMNSVGIATHVDLDSDLPLVTGHHGQLQEVMINLLQNAIEAMKSVKDGERKVQLSTKHQEDGSILLEVKDSGSGIHPANLDRIFDTFFTTKADGMGLGLAICRSIIERHGGRLSASSDGRNGAAFQLFLYNVQNLSE